MKLAIIGAGAIGSVAAAYLHKAGVDVTLIGREDQVAVIQEKGLKVTGVRGEETFQIRALSQLDQKYDLVIFTTKSQDLEMAFAHNSQFLEDCLVLSSQNGVQGDNILSSHFYPDLQLSSIVMFGATYIQPGEVVFNFEGDWIIGKPWESIDPKTHEVGEILGQAFNTIVSPDIMGMKWTKLFVNFNNCIPAVLGVSMQEAFADLDMCRLSVMLLKEGVEIVHEAKIELISLPNFPVDRIFGLSTMPTDKGAQIIHETLTNLSKAPLYGSILQSIKRGKMSEIDFINGEVVAMGSGMRVATPLNAKMVDMVHEVERTGNFYSFEDVKKEFNLT